MTPKEKAEELVDKMHNTEHCGIKHFPNERYCDCIAMNAFQAKQCALKAVNEMIVQNGDVYLAMLVDKANDYYK